MSTFCLTVSTCFEVEIEAVSLDAAKQEANLLERMQADWFDLQGIGIEDIITGAAVTNIEEVEEN